MSKILPYLLALLIGISACNKKHDPVPSNTPTQGASGTTGSISTAGSFSGIISPARAVSVITVVMSATGQSYSCTPDTSTGSFKLENLPEGKYRISFATNGHYNALAYLDAYISGGSNNNLGTFITKETNFYLGCQVNGTFQGWLFKGYYSPPYFSIGPLIIGSYPEDMRTAYYLDISLDSLTKAGTYMFKGASKSKMTYSGYRLGNGFRISYQSTEYAGGDATVIITSIDPNSRIIKGTFTATLMSASGNAADTKIITNGIINAPY